MIAKTRNVGLMLAVLSLGGVEWALAEDGSDFDRVQVGEISYDIPKTYNASSASPNSIFMKVDASSWGPAQKEKTGWDHNVLILVEPQNNTVAENYDRQWDGSPINASANPRNHILQKYRIDPDLTVTVLGGRWPDSVVPDQDLSRMPLGFLLCGRYDPPIFLDASCKYLFDRDGQRWQVSFGRQELKDYREYRDRATALLDSFRMEVE